MLILCLQVVALPPNEYEKNQLMQVLKKIFSKQATHEMSAVWNMFQTH